MAKSFEFDLDSGASLKIQGRGNPEIESVEYRGGAAVIRIGDPKSPDKWLALTIPLAALQEMAEAVEEPEDEDGGE